MGRILDKVRDAVKRRNEDVESSEDEKKDSYSLSSMDEDRIREFETRLGNMQDIVRELEREDVDTGDIRSEIRDEMGEIS